jgi:hypothetical protein
MRAVNPVPRPLVSGTVPPAELKFNVIDDARADVRVRKLVARTASPRVVRDLFFMVWMWFVGLGRGKQLDQREGLPQTKMPGSPDGK